MGTTGVIVWLVGVGALTLKVVLRVRGWLDVGQSGEFRCCNIFGGVLGRHPA